MALIDSAHKPSFLIWMYTCRQQIKFHDTLPRNCLNDPNGGNTFTAYSSTCLVFLKVHACTCIAATFYIKPGHRTKLEYWGVNKSQFYANSLFNWLTAWIMRRDCLTTVWWLPDDCLMTAWWLPDGCLMAAWRLPDNCLVTAGWRPDNCLTTA